MEDRRMKDMCPICCGEPYPDMQDYWGVCDHCINTKFPDETTKRSLGFHLPLPVECFGLNWDEDEEA